jgi:hypothetical protein
MFTRKELEKRIAKKAEDVTLWQEEVIEAEKQLAAAKSYVQALQDMLKLCPESEEPALLREGSFMAKARDAIRAAGKPLHINDLMKTLGVEINTKAKTSLAGSLSGYARKAKIFTRPAANTFGLLELQATEPSEEAETEKEVPKNVVSI